MAIVIIHGAQGSGKTRRQDQLLKHYGCSRFVEEWDGRSPLIDGDLAVTNTDGPFRVRGATYVHITEAKRAIT